MVFYAMTDSPRNTKHQQVCVLLCGVAGQINRALCCPSPSQAAGLLRSQGIISCTSNTPEPASTSMGVLGVHAGHWEVGSELKHQVRQTDRQTSSSLDF